ncbi:complement factor H-related protein 2-like isoform X4 [Mauremys reevesii]|uniref:complement factor H-related protein 2-like isoform X4 n=1 Tax=Mauremys reevesii TaxID=260615 RepID=UPI00193FAD63|nr:complement factor H-related protein 2-like isoform X4 [Mauremys reevesii]
MTQLGYTAVLVLWACSTALAISCGNIENGRVKPSFFFQRRKRTFECNAGYIAENDNNRIECTSSGWSPVPRCIPIQCGRIENGKIVDKVEEKTTFRCNHGYKSENGINETTCSSEGWSPVPICIAPCIITRQQLETKKLLLSNGRRRTVLIQSDQTMEFLCGEHSDLKIPYFIKCVDGRMDLPTCISGTGEKCGRPPTIENGDITTLSLKEYAFGSLVEYRCQHYYIIEGDRKSYCYNGIWTKVPVCLEPCVITQEDMRSRNIDLKGESAQKRYVSHGDFVEFKCRSSFFPNSSNNYRVQCNAGQIPYPQCT